MTHAENHKIHLSDGFVPMGPGITNESFPRIDPLVDAADIDSMYHGYHAFKWGTKNGTADTVRLPIRPTGRLPYEELIQAAVFVIPLIFLTSVALYNDITTLVGKWTVFFAGVGAWLIGVMLNVALQARIKHKLDKESSLYNSAYYHFRYVSARLNLSIRELTFERLKKLHDDYVAAEKIGWAEWNKKNSDEAIARAARVNARRFAKQTGGESASYGLPDYEDYYTENDDTPAYAGVNFNPASGLPLIEYGGGIDVGGNIYGTNDSMH